MAVAVAVVIAVRTSIESLFSYPLTHRRARIRLDETLAARWAPQGLTKYASIPPPISTSLPHMTYAGRNATGSRALLLCKVLVGKDKLIPSTIRTPTYQQLRLHH
jgi:hypothetical protein